MTPLKQSEKRLYDLYVLTAVKAGIPDREVAEVVRGTTTGSVRRYRRKQGLFRTRGRKPGMNKHNGWEGQHG
jgi:hypothetical protein